MNKSYVTYSIVLLAFISAWFVVPSYVNADTRVVVVGEDSNKRSAPRTGEVYKRVVSELQTSLARSGYYVIDEDMLAVKLGFKITSRRPKTELIQTLMVANETEDATVQSRLATVFAVFPQIKKLSFTRKLKVRIRGDVYDLKTLRPLANFEYSPRKAYVIPASFYQCDDFCVSEIVGKNSREIARELGDVLVKKLKIAVRAINGGSSGASSGSGNSRTGMLTTYNLKLIRIKTVQAIRFKKHLAGYQGIKEINTISSRSSERTLALNATLKPGNIEEAVLESLMEVGVNVDEIRFEMSGTNIEIENLR